MSVRTRGPAVLIGLALGDALGAPFEGRPRVGREAVHAWQRASDPLRWTDDTHMALTLARVLVGDRRLEDPERLGDAFAAAYAEEPWRGYGAGPPRVFALVEAGASHRQAAASLFGGSGSFGNGAAMRVAPVGLLAEAGDPVAVERLAAAQSEVTHTHAEAIEGAVLVADLVATLLRAPVRGRAAVRGAVEAVADRRRDGEVGRRVAAVLDEAADDPEQVAVRGAAGVAARDSVPAAVAALLAGGDVLEVVTVAVRIGGDTDTVAAMAGAMAAAAWGTAGVPAQLLARLEAREQLEQLGATLAGG